FIIHEHHTNAMKACIRELCTYDYQPENGYYVAPELPGLGQELNDEIVQQYLAYVIK
ncbi:TPA: mandelate racemase/muconate lactonizing enzyme family protein, partial [Escherichia coli]